MKNKFNPLYFLENGGEMGQLMRAKDWTQTELGTPEKWPQSLQTTLSIILNSPFPMFLWWGKDLICFYNDAYRPSLGKNGKHPSILGMRAKEAWPEIWDQISPLIQSVIENGAAIWRENQLVPIFRNGQLENVYWTFSYSPVNDGSGHVAGVLVICRDTTETVIAGNSLRESERRFRKIADLSPIWIWITDTEVNVEYTNRELLDYFGIDHYSNFTGQIWEKFAHPQDIDIIRESWKAAAQNQTEFSVECRVINKLTGQYEWFNFMGVPLFKGEKLEGFLGTAVSIEKQKFLSAQLEKEVQLRTRELALGNAELEKMNAELQSFAYISSHDLQEPLRKIQMFAGVLLEREYDNLSPNGKNKFMRIQSAANRMQTLINDLLAYSRTETEERVFESKTLEELVSDAKSDLMEEIENKDATIEVTDNCKIEVVPFQFRQLLYNIMANSLKYAKEFEAPIIKIKGSIVPSSELNDERLVKDINYAQIELSDNGIGFDSSYSEKIFEVFQRLHTRQDYVGTGIGLAIVKKIVQNHDGVIDAKGELGKGATFQILIPDRSHLK
jgi:hypothetical protein